ncbi:MAG: pilus assembly protein PilP [Psychromonas sp.]
MKHFIILLVSFALFSCVEIEMDDLKDFVAEAKSKEYPINDKVPKLKKIDALLFMGKEESNPFSEPLMNVVPLTIDPPQRCLKPNFLRKKGVLEKHALDHLLMRGTLLVNNQLWALVQTPSGEVHKVKHDYYLGLQHGKVLAITQVKIELLELVPDRKGCWQARVTQMTLQSQ